MILGLFLSCHLARRVASRRVESNRIKEDKPDIPLRRYRADNHLSPGEGVVKYNLKLQYFRYSTVPNLVLFDKQKENATMRRSEEDFD